MTADPIPEVRQAVGGAEPLVAVFIPTTPNPTSGFLVMVPRADVRELEMSVPDGMQYLISLGVVAPGEISGAFPADEPAPSRYNARPL